MMADMVIVAGEMYLMTEKREEALELIRWVMAETQKEAGCIQYTFSASLEEPDLIHIFEKWESDDALDAHLQTAHLAEFRSKIGPCVAKPSHVMRYHADAGRKV